MIGAALFTLLPESLKFFQSYDILVYGALLMAIMIFLPEGLTGLLGRGYGRLSPLTARFRKRTAIPGETPGSRPESSPE